MRVGSAVTKYKVGDRVGVGCLVNSCGKCEPCKAGLEQYCDQDPIWTYSSKDPVDGTDTKGGYSTIMVAPEHFVLSIPEALDMAKAAPLLCAGITMYSPLMHWKTAPGTRSHRRLRVVRQRALSRRSRRHRDDPRKQRGSRGPEVQSAEIERRDRRERHDEARVQAVHAAADPDPCRLRAHPTPQPRPRGRNGDGGRCRRQPHDEAAEDQAASMTPRSGGSEIRRRFRAPGSRCSPRE